MTSESTLVAEPQPGRPTLDKSNYLPFNLNFDTNEPNTTSNLHHFRDFHLVSIAWSSCPSGRSSSSSTGATLYFLKNDFSGCYNSDEWRGLCEGYLHPDLHQQAGRLQRMVTTHPPLRAQKRPEEEAEGGDHQPDDIPQWHRLEAD